MILDAPEHVHALREAAESLAPRVLSLTREISEIPAPTNDEGQRSRFFQRHAESLGLTVACDDLGDVVARIPGRLAPGAGGRPLLIAAHLDTVFGKSVPLEVNASEGRLAGPGIGDNSLAVASVLSLPQLYVAAGLKPAVDVLITGNVGEEGLGNLRGIREVLTAHPEVGAVIALEGHTLGRVTHVAVGSRRYRITAVGPGGHSWGDFGQPNAIHAMARFIADLDAIPLPRMPKTTLNVGTIEGGVSVNTIAPTVSCLLDLRSTDEQSLQRLSERVVRLAAKHSRPDGVTVTLETIGERPAGVVAVDSPVVKMATATLNVLGVDATLDASSTDANVPIAAGIPAVCIGLTSGGNVHRVDEYIDTIAVPTGLAQLGLLSLAVCELLAANVIQI
ncbi:MAG: M20/M25/M40 family metallo-hydrolase [Thermomicrobiales bacterium]|nr:M20/M25/M40 family metallo-hydrolase [Thermomicrobiales bacterium]